MVAEIWDDEMDRQLREVVEKLETTKTDKFSELATIAGLNIAEDFIGVDLSGEDLSNDNLSGADFSEADLSNTNLNGTDLSNANLSGANLSGANLSGANLSGANVTNALFISNLGLSEELENDLQQRGAINVRLALIEVALNRSEQTLQELVRNAQNYPKNSKDRIRCVTKIVREIVGIYKQKIIYPSVSLTSSPLAQEIWNEALQKTLTSVVLNIDEYNPQESLFLEWVNGILVQQNSSTIDPYTPIAPSDVASIENWEHLWKVIEQDPRGRFKEKFWQTPEANFQAIALQRRDNKSWEEIIKFFGLTDNAEIGQFYRECTQDFRGIFEEFVIRGQSTVQISRSLQISPGAVNTIAKVQFSNKVVGVGGG
ncbi:MAG: pentapeptide repeat-containing protein [Microcystis sp.]